jgi:hypothetical protein
MAKFHGLRGYPGPPLEEGGPGVSETGRFLDTWAALLGGLVLHQKSASEKPDIIRAWV